MLEKLPAFLIPGDAVALVATARHVEDEIVRLATEFLESAGFVVDCFDGLMEGQNQFAGPDELRASGINKAFFDPKIKAILCLRGGYGTVRILEHLDEILLKNNPKWIVGYSDVTVLHAYMGVRSIVSIHGTMPVSFPSSTADSLSYLLKALKGELTSYSNVAVDGHRIGSAKGVLRGGNISVLYSLSGSELNRPQPGTILFLEDLDEYLYHLDRMMMNFKLLGWFDALEGLIVGGLSDMRDNTMEFGFDKDNAFGKDARTIIEGYVKDYSFPVCFDFPAGHTTRNLPLFLNRNIEIEVRPNEIDINWG